MSCLLGMTTKSYVEARKKPGCYYDIMINMYIYIQYMFYAVLHLLKDFYRSNNGKFSEMTLLVSNVEPTEEATHCA